MLYAVLGGAFWSRVRVTGHALIASTQEARRANVSPGNEQWAVRRFDFDELVLVSISNGEGQDAVFQAVVEVPRP